MTTRLAHYSNDVWLSALESDGGEPSPLIAELAHYLDKVLGSTLSSKKLAKEDISDLCQEAMLQILKSVDSFRGDSAFPTWAAAVATRVAFTELRRRAAHEAKHAAFRQAQADALQSSSGVCDSSDSATRAHVMLILHEAIDSELTDRQRIATLALLRGVPTIEIAEQLGSNQNAVYKLVHDARLRLRDVLQRRGVTPEVIDDVSAAGTSSGGGAQ